MLNTPPRKLPFSNLLKVRLKKVLLLLLGDRSVADGLMLMSASAFFHVFGDEGDEKSLRGGGRFASSALS